MRDKLIIYLHANDLTNPSWATGSYTHHGETESLAQAAAEREVIVIVPAEDVVLVNAKVPKMNRSRLIQALPYALEEQMIADVEDLHFAASDYQADGNLPVAVISHEKMRQWIALLQSWNIAADVMIPLTLALPFENTAWHILVHDMAVVRTGQFRGFACDKNNFIEMLQLALTTLDSKPQFLCLHNYTNHAYTNALNVTAAKVKEEFLNQDQMINDLAKSVINTQWLNLLQGIYAVKKRSFPKLNLGWKVAAYLGVIWIGLLFFYPSVSYMILKHKINIIDDQIAQIYMRHFPQATSIVAPKLRMQEKLQNLSAKIGENQSLLLMGYIGKGMLETPSIKIKRFDYQNGQTTLELTAASSEDFSAFTDYLTRQGLSVKQQNANLVGGRISATLQIE